VISSQIASEIISGRQLPGWSGSLPAPDPAGFRKSAAPGNSRPAPTSNTAGGR